MSNGWIRRVAFLVCMGAGVLSMPLSAQQAPGAAAVTQLPTFKVDLLFLRFQGTQRTSSMPYSLLVDSGTDLRMAPTTQLRIGIDAPTGRTTSRASDGAVLTVPEYKYVGTNIDCRAEYRGTTTYRIFLNLEDYSFASPTLTGEATATPPRPRFDYAIRRFAVTNTLTVRDGQAVQFSVGTDPITGETIRAEVTVTAVK
jgi:hypothetical protein